MFTGDSISVLPVCLQSMHLLFTDNYLYITCMFTGNESFVYRRIAVFYVYVYSQRICCLQTNSCIYYVYVYSQWIGCLQTISCIYYVYSVCLQSIIWYWHTISFIYYMYIVCLQSMNRFFTGDYMDKAVTKAYQSLLLLTVRQPDNLEYLQFAEEVKVRSKRDYGYEFKNDEVSR